MKTLTTAVLAFSGWVFAAASFYRMWTDPNSSIIFLIFMVFGALVGLRADWFVNRITAPKPMAVHVIGKPRKRFQKNFY